MDLNSFLGWTCIYRRHFGWRQGFPAVEGRREWTQNGRKVCRRGRQSLETLGGVGG